MRTTNITPLVQSYGTHLLHLTIKLFVNPVPINILSNSSKPRISANYDLYNMFIDLQETIYSTQFSKGCSFRSKYKKHIHQTHYIQSYCLLFLGLLPLIRGWPTTRQTHSVTPLIPSTPSSYED